MRPRFHVPGLNSTADRIELPEDEAEHLVRVLRLGIGDAIDVIDGRGGLWRAEVVHAGKRSASIRVRERGIAAAELTSRLSLVMSVLKGDKIDDVVRDAVMMGIASIQPVVSERSEISLATLARSNRVARWRRIAVASAKQCGRAVVPPVQEVVTLDSYWQIGADRATRIMCVEPTAAPGDMTSVQAIPQSPVADLIIGPEGGWTGTEVATARESGAILMSLGGRTLRADAVPLVALTALLTTWSELK